MRVAKYIPYIMTDTTKPRPKKDHGFMIAYYSIAGVTGALE